MVIPVDPYLVHVYWEVAPAQVREVNQALGQGASGLSPVLKFRWVSNETSGIENCEVFLEVPFDLAAPNWYVHLPGPSGAYFVELGLRAGDGRFSVLARSAVVHPPPASPSKNTEETMMLVLGDYALLNLPREHREGPAAGPGADAAPPAPVVEMSEEDGAQDIDSEPERTPLPPPAIPAQPDGPCWEESTGVVPAESEDQAVGPGSSPGPDLVEVNERSFVRGLSSV